MKVFILTLLTVPAILTAQEDTAKTWTHSGMYSFAASQTTLTNWNAGGENSLNISALLRQGADYARGKWQWSNMLEANYAVSYQGSSALKTGDKLEVTTRGDRNINASGSWTASAFANFRTQFVDGFSTAEDSVPISTFMAPGYLLGGVGFTHKREFMQIYMSPATAKWTFVNDQSLADQGAFGVTPGENLRTELGAYVNVAYNRPITPNMEVMSKLDLFSNYLEDPQYVDVNWETIFMLKAYSVITVSLHLHLIYDHDILVRTPDAEGVMTEPGAQFKQVLGVGVAYAFGKYKG